MGLDNPLHIAFLVVILLLVFGAKRLPEIGRSLGSGMREFKDSITGERPDNAQQQAALPQASQQPAPMPAAQPAATQAPAPPPPEAPQAPPADAAAPPAEPTRQA
ncbi:MAG: sec-independent protein translocase protein TatA [Solirubrobacteraceae bacterium]|jgi:sec-independent protein translocase protein TatA|nr:sec-independent protein translocase protein TatA [Solirubrobacteraceae bacterium]